MNLKEIEKQLQLKDTLDNLKTGQFYWNELQLAKQAEYQAAQKYADFKHKFSQQTKQIIQLCENYDFMRNQFVCSVQTLEFTDKTYTQIRGANVLIDNKSTTYIEKVWYDGTDLCDMILESTLIENKHTIEYSTINDDKYIKAMTQDEIDKALSAVCGEYNEL